MTPERWRQVDSLYHAALEQAPEGRAAFLRDSCRGDEDLRRELESLLARDASAEGLFDRPPWEAEANLIEAHDTSTFLSAGMLLGPYKIEAPLGAGGMGQVYKARDTRLGRAVAIKILAEQFSGRFAREARAISALNHPHICTLHDVGDNYLVMELIEGETLAERLKKGALPMEHVLEYAGQIAGALAAAHARGIIHRDLKPGNIMLTKSGVKVLDFGLAKSHQDETLTSPEAVMGSPAYMAPEQRDGKECDARTDIYALGLVLYEMATGGRIVREQERTISGVPAQLAPIIERCIACDPEDRWQSAKDVKMVLEWASKSQAALVVAKSTWPWILLTAVLLTIIAAGALWAWFRASGTAPLRPLIRLDAEIPPDTPLATNNDGGMLAISPDGSRLAFTLRGPDGKIRLHTRLLRENQVTPLAGTENAHSPFFSPDGQWIGFFANSKLKKIPFFGGGAVALCDVPTSSGASWSTDGNIVFTPTIYTGLSRVSSEGGIPVPLTNPKQLAGVGGYRFPQMLPGNEAVLFTTLVNSPRSDNDSADIDVVSIKTGQLKTLQHGGYSGRYVVTPNGSGRLIYLRHGTLFAAPFNIERLEVTGTPVPVLEKVTSGTGGGNFAFSSSGTFVYLAGEEQQGYRKVFWADASGKTQPLEATPAGYLSPRFSPDGKRLAFAIARHNGSDLWVKDLDRDTPSRLTFLDGISWFPVWTPDGKNIIFKYNNAISCIRSDGAGQPQPLTHGGDTPRSISPDGKRLAYLHYADPYHPEVVTAPIEGDSDHLRLGKPEVFLGAGLADSSPMFSPDGRWMVYVSSESGSAEVYVRPFPGPGGRWQISSHGGLFPVWSRVGKELLYQAPDQRLMAVSYTAQGNSFVAAKPRVWSDARVMSPYLNTLGWDLAPDGKHIAGILEPAFGSLTFLLNFFDELERRVPAGSSR